MGHEVVLDTLINSGANIKAAGGYFNWTAFDDDALAKLMLSAGADSNLPDSSGYPAMLLAVQGGHRAVVARLLNADGNENFPRITAVYLTANGRHNAIVPRLLDAGANIEYQWNGHRTNGDWWGQHVLTGRYTDEVRFILYQIVSISYQQYFKGQQSVVWTLVSLTRSSGTGGGDLVRIAKPRFAKKRKTHPTSIVELG